MRRFVFLSYVQSVFACLRRLAGRKNPATKTNAGIIAARLRGPLMLASAVCLLFLPAADTQRPEDITVHVHVIWTGNVNQNHSEGKNQVEENDEITITYDVTSHKTAPAGTPPWGIYTGTDDYQFTVSGGGSGTMHLGGSSRTYSRSWTYHLVNTPKGDQTVIEVQPGSFQVTLPELNRVKIEAQMQGDSQPKDLEGTFVDTFGALSVGPMAMIAVDSLDVPSTADDLDILTQFATQLKGTFDQNSKAFSRSGSASRSHSNPRLGMTSSIRVSYSLNFNQQPEQLEAVIIPENDYDQWMPQAGEDEDTPANTLYAAVMLRKKGDKNKAPAQTAQFEVSLVDVSHEPGVSMNWPSQQAVHTPPGPDLKIDKNQSPDLHVESDGQSAKSDPGKREVIVGITSFDWGAYGKLKVIAHVSDGSTLTVYWEGHPDKQELAIPRDDNGNHIADKWEKDNGVFGQDAKSDLDADPPGDSTPGDGLSLYEEYRGFRVEDEGGHIRTDPNRKDLFVVNRSDLPMALFAESGLVVHLVQKSETGLDEQGKDPNPWIINFNHGDFAHLGSEHVLWLVDAQLENGTIGETGDAIIGKGIGPPRSVSAALVRVDRRQCLASKWGQTELMSTVAHELAHGSNVRHHGGVGYRATCARLLGQAAPDYYTQKYDVTVQGDVNSGDHDCIMRYTGGSELSQAPASEEQDQPLSWLDARNIKARKIKKCPDPSSQNEGWIAGDFYTTHRRQDLPEPPGTTFCKNPNGEPFPKSGNATLGTCAKQFCVNDVTPCKFTGQ